MARAFFFIFILVDSVPFTLTSPSSLSAVSMFGVGVVLPVVGVSLPGVSGVFLPASVGAAALPFDVVLTSSGLGEESAEPSSSNFITAVSSISPSGSDPA